MIRFFFNVASKGTTISDTKGREFADLAAAHRHAMQLIHKVVLLDGADWEGWYIKITDPENRSCSVYYCRRLPVRSGQSVSANAEGESPTLAKQARLCGSAEPFPSAFTGH